MKVLEKVFGNGKKQIVIEWSGKELESAKERKNAKEMLKVLRSWSRFTKEVNEI